MNGAYLCLEVDRKIDAPLLSTSWDLLSQDLEGSGTFCLFEARRMSLVALYDSTRRVCSYVGMRIEVYTLVLFFDNEYTCEDHSAMDVQFCFVSEL